VKIRIALIALAAGLGAVGALAAPPQADAKATPCWERLLDDWVVDGRIDKTYPASCYREAMKHLPRDLEEYSSVREDLERALNSAARGSGGDPPRTIPPANDGRASDPLPGVDIEDGVATDSSDESLFNTLLPRATGADSVPLPLLVLAGLALLLLAAAAVSFAARRVQAHRVRASGPRGGPPAV
jgi:hypothetical protein